MEFKLAQVAFSLSYERTVIYSCRDCSAPKASFPVKSLPLGIRFTVYVAKGLKFVNKTREELGGKLYTQVEYEERLDDLASIKSIDIRNNEIILTEQIRIKY